MGETKIYTVGELIEVLKKYPMDTDVEFRANIRETVELDDYTVMNDTIEYELDEWMDVESIKLTKDYDGEDVLEINLKH